MTNKCQKSETLDFPDLDVFLKGETPVWEKLSI